MLKKEKNSNTTYVIAKPKRKHQQSAKFICGDWNDAQRDHLSTLADWTTPYMMKKPNHHNFHCQVSQLLSVLARHHFHFHCLLMVMMMNSSSSLSSAFYVSVAVQSTYDDPCSVDIFPLCAVACAYAPNCSGWCLTMNLTMTKATNSVVWYTPSRQQPLLHSTFYCGRFLIKLDISRIAT